MVYIEPGAQLLSNRTLRIGPRGSGQEIVKVGGEPTLSHERRFDPRPQKRSHSVAMSDRAASAVDGENPVHRCRRMDPARTREVASRIPQPASKLEPFKILTEARREPFCHAAAVQHRCPLAPRRHEVGESILHLPGVSVGRKACDKINSRSISSRICPLVIDLGGALEE